MTTRYTRLVVEDLGGAEGPLRQWWEEFVPDENIRPKAARQGGGEPTRKVCAPPPGMRRDKAGALHFTKWRPRPVSTDIELYRVRDTPEQETP